MSRSPGSRSACRVAAVEARRGAARTVGAGGLGVGVEVELLGVVDQPQLGGEVVVVDLVDPVDQGDLLGQHVRRCRSRRRTTGRWSAPGGSSGAGPAARRRVRGRRAAPATVSRQRRDLALDDAAARLRGRSADAVAQVRGGAAPVVGRVDVPVARPPGVRTKAWKPIGVMSRRDGGTRVVDADARPGGDLGVSRGELGLHGWVRSTPERLQAAVGSGDLDDASRRRAACGSSPRRAPRSTRVAAYSFGSTRTFAPEGSKPRRGAKAWSSGAAATGAIELECTCSHDEGQTSGKTARARWHTSSFEGGARSLGRSTEQAPYLFGSGCRSGLDRLAHAASGPARRAPAAGARRARAALRASPAAR